MPLRTILLSILLLVALPATPQDEVPGDEGIESIQIEAARLAAEKQLVEARVALLTAERNLKELEYLGSE